MEHCRGFVKGLKIGLLAAPLMGILSFKILIVVPITIIFSAFWFVRLVGVRWLYEHGLYFGN